MKENNILLAEFLGWKEQTDPTERWFGSFRTPEGIVHKNTNKEPLLFHTDWNWLMEVIRKIEQLPNVYDIEEFLLIRDELITGRLENSYHAVVEFVEWWNKENN